MYYRPSKKTSGNHSPSSQYPPVNTDMFTHSVGESNVLVDQAKKLLEKLGDNEYATEIMELAQEGKKEAVDQMIHSIDGINIPITIVYTPTGINFVLGSPATDVHQFQCCHIEMALKWGK